MLMCVPPAALSHPVDQEHCLVLFYRMDPWLMVVGSDSPVFALYDNGNAIFHPKKSKTGQLYDSVTLSSTEQKELLHLLSGLAQVKDSYRLCESTDQPTSHLFLKIPPLEKSIQIYGNLESTKKAVIDAKMRLPSNVVTAFERLSNFQHDRSSPWLPKFIEVMVWPFEYSKDTPVAWPSNWPDMNESHTKKRGDSYSIFLPSADLNKLQDLLKQRKPTTAVLINGKKWAVSYRFPFPDESMSKTIKHAEEKH